MLTGRLRFLPNPVIPFALAEEQRAHISSTLSKQLKVKVLEDFYKVTRKRIDKVGGDAFVNVKLSMSTILIKLYPEYNWNVYGFSSGVPNGYWDDIAHHRHFFNYFGEMFLFHDLDCWYDCSVDLIATHGGGGVINDKYNGSVFAALEAVYPERTWKPWLFRHSPAHIWDCLRNQRMMCDRICEAMKLKITEDMYCLTTYSFIQHGGGSILSLKYRGSLFRLLTAVYPEFKWVIYEFKSISQGYWNEPANVIEFFKDLETLLEIQEPNDWYRVGNAVVGKYGGRSLLTSNGIYRYPTCLKLLYKDHNWDWQLFRSTVIPNKSSQRVLIWSLKTLLTANGISVEHERNR